MQLSLHTLFYCLHENIYHIFQFLCRRLFINNLGGYGILAIPTYRLPLIYKDEL